MELEAENAVRVGFLAAENPAGNRDFELAYPSAFVISGRHVETYAII